MKILVIGGSYFLGKHFVNLASKNNDVIVFNRGNRPHNNVDVREIKGDRHVKEDIDKLRTVEVDVVVDFCAYNKGDISDIIAVLGPSLKQYVFISTVDVYKKGLGQTIDENSPLETRNYGGEIGQYISGKVSLERELELTCCKNKIAYTSIRPVFIYGPDNYAPREGIFLNWIDKAGQVLIPEDESGFFQMIYVDDLADIIYKICANELSFNKAINVCGEGVYNYREFLDTLSMGCKLEFERILVPVEYILNHGIELPFPLTKEESEKYRSVYKNIYECKTRLLADGLRDTYKWYKLKGLNLETNC